MIRQEFSAMGTDIVVRTTGDPAVAEQYIAACESRFSRFLSTSELSRLNSDRSARTSLSKEMKDILTKAADLRERTEGLVDIGVGSAVNAWGYSRSFRAGATVPDRPKPLAPSTWSIEGDCLELSEGVLLDLGGIAKGWACDRLVEDHGVIVASAGGDLRSNHRSLTVEVDAGDTRIEVPVGIGALATSSTLRRNWIVEGEQVSHLMDPRSMEPTRSPIVSATVVTESAIEAEAGAKAVLLRGSDGLAWAAEQAWIRVAIAVWHDGSVYATKERAAA